jgi:hypothetical protein
VFRGICSLLGADQFDFCSRLSDGGSFWGGVAGGNAKLLKASKVDKEYDEVCCCTLSSASILLRVWLVA